MATAQEFWESWLNSLTTDEAETLENEWRERELNRMFRGISSGNLLIQNLNLFEVQDSNKYLRLEEDFSERTAS